MIVGLVFYVALVLCTTTQVKGFDWGGCVGVLAGLYFMALLYGAMGLFASSLTKNQVVALIIGMIFCTFFFFVGQFDAFFPAFLARTVDFTGVTSHVDSLGRGVWDIRDLLYFGSMIGLFLYLTVQKLNARRF
jgi:ABC-2 type transport system permease protein